MTYRNKILKKNVNRSEINYCKGGGARKAIPVGHSKPTTFNQAVMQILYNSGQMTQEQYLSALGIGFDYNSSKEFEDDYGFDNYEGDIDGFTQSERASYVERSNADEQVGTSNGKTNIPVPETGSVETRESGIASNPSSPDSQSNSPEFGSATANQNSGAESSDNQ